MAGRVLVHLEAAVRIQVVGGSQQLGADGDGVVVRLADVVDVQVEVQLLLGAVRPVGTVMVRRQLEAAADGGRIRLAAGTERRRPAAGSYLPAGPSATTPAAGAGFRQRCRAARAAPMDAAG